MTMETTRHECSTSLEQMTPAIKTFKLALLVLVCFATAFSVVTTGLMGRSLSIAVASDNLAGVWYLLQDAFSTHELYDMSNSRIMSLISNARYMGRYLLNN